MANFSQCFGGNSVWKQELMRYEFMVDDQMKIKLWYLNEENENKFLT